MLKLQTSLITLLFLSLPLLLNSCQVFQSTSSAIQLGADVIALGDKAEYQLQGVPTHLTGTTLLQKMMVTSPEDKHVLLVQTELFKDKITMVGFSQSGLQLFQLTWQPQGELAVSTNIVLPDLDVEKFMAYYQLSSWPIPAILPGLHGMKVNSPAKDASTRQFFIGQELIFSVSQNQQSRTMIHHRDDYQIKIENID